MIVKNFGCAVFGVNATAITVETNITKGKYFFMVGLPDNAVKESHQRVSAAISEVAQIPQDVVWVVFNDVTTDDWFVGDKSVTRIKAAQK